MTHEPKIAALLALRERRLSPAGRARMERHLASCAACRRALAAITLYERTTEEIRDADVPELDWSRMELALAREARAVAKRGPVVAAEQERGPVVAAEQERGPAVAAEQKRGPASASRSGATARPWAAYAAAAAALVLFAIWAWPESGPELATPERPAPSVTPPRAPIGPVVEAPEPAALMASVTLVAGHATVRDAEGAEQELGAGDVLAEGVTVLAAESSEVHVRIATATGVVLRERSDAHLTRMREGDVGIALERGRLVGVVDGEVFAAESRFVVMAAEHRFEGRATRFEIEIDEPTGLLRLRVADGEVSVHRPDGRVNVVSAPGSWSNEGEALAREVGSPHGIGDDATDWPVLRVSHPDVVRWEIGEVAVAGAGSLGMRVGPGEIAVAGFDRGGRAFRTVADIGGDGLTIDATGLVPEAPRARAGGYLPQEDIQEVMRRGQVRLRQCYEQGMREQPDLEGSMRVQITVGLDGSVARYRHVEGDVPEGVQACVRNYVERWSFPPPRGGTVTFEAPLRFGPR